MPFKPCSFHNVSLTLVSFEILTIYMVVHMEGNPLNMCNFFCQVISKLGGLFLGLNR